MAQSAFKQSRRSAPARRDALLLGGLLATFGALLILAARRGPTGFDRAIMRRMQGIPWGRLGIVPRLGSDVGGGVIGFYLLPVLVAAVLARERKWRRVALVPLLYALHYALIAPKLLVRASRPSPSFGVRGEGGLRSFPSGHVQWAVSFYGLLACLIWRHTNRLLPRAGIATLYTGVVSLTALGRMSLGRHWPIDVLAGAVAGLLALRVVLRIDDRLDRRAHDLSESQQPGDAQRCAERARSPGHD